MTSLHIHHDARTWVVPLRDDRISIGRAADNDVVIDSAAASRRHAVMERCGDAWTIRDLNSRNGTFINGLRVTEGTVRAADTITIAERTIRVVDSSVVDGLDGATERLTRPRNEGSLTPREREVVRLVALGHTDASIAVTLSISLKTVQSHLDRIRDKTGSRRRPDLTRLAAELGLLA